ncbi:MAG: T9SS type A sorting domain-containing protein, partial [Candidatus Coatesbacteria bacterium]|nr:T9SS type A sorting domain-containing protein [Candidatus Coatesbacteria bacterium]
SSDETLKYWRISDGSCIRTFTGHSGTVYSVAISPDGQYALSGSRDYTLKYWRISDGSWIRTFTGHSGWVYDAVYSSLNLKVLAPNGGEQWEVGSQNTIQWTNVGEDSLNISYSTNSGSTWIQVATVPCDPNSYLWTVPDTPSEECLVKVCPKAGAPVDQSDAVFTIYKKTGFFKTTTEKALPISFSVSPNPFSERLTITVPSSAAVYDITGRMIARLDKGRHSLDTSRWREGVYIVQSGKEAKRIVKIK